MKNKPVQYYFKNQVLKFVRGVKLWNVINRSNTCLCHVFHGHFRDNFILLKKMSSKINYNIFALHMIRNLFEVSRSFLRIDFTRNIFYRATSEYFVEPRFVEGLEFVAFKNMTKIKCGRWQIIYFNCGYSIDSYLQSYFAVSPDTGESAWRRWKDLKYSGIPVCWDVCNFAAIQAIFAFAK